MTLDRRVATASEALSASDSSPSTPPATRVLRLRSTSDRSSKLGSTTLEPEYEATVTTWTTIEGESRTTALRKGKRSTSEKRKRELSVDSDEAQSSVGNSRKPQSQSSKKGKRGYADPEVYAHLHFIPDYLQPGLDVVFCGINPGYMSAQVGHHFANPTNHFWRCLHSAGLTSSFVPPSEDYSLLERFNFGLTNLVDRPSAEASELSKSEMVASVPTFLAKITRHKPRFVCFVGMGIWDVVKSALDKMQIPSTASSVSGKGKEQAERSQPREPGLQSYKMVYLPPEGAEGKVSETLFFVVPSTSGRVVRYQLTDKIAFFTKLRALVHKSPAEIDTSKMQTVVLETQSS